MKEPEILTLAARQHGLAHQKQLADLGLTKYAIQHLVESGRWLRVGAGHVLKLAGSPRTARQDAMLAVLDLNPDGAALSHDTAAARWGLTGFDLRPFHVMGDRIRGRNDDHVGIVHQPRLLLPDHVVGLHGIPTVSPTLTLFHLAGVIRWPKKMSRVVDNALSAGLTSVPLLQRTLKRYAKRGRTGSTLMRELIEEREGGYVPPASGLEWRFRDLARQCGLDDFDRQVDVGDQYDWIGRVDFIDRKRRIIVEVQSARYHGAMVDVERDAARIAALRAAGWTVIEVREFDLWYNPEKVIAQLRDARR